MTTHSDAIKYRAAALDETLADALEWESHEYGEAVAGIRRGYAYMQAGRTRPLKESFDELSEKYHLSCYAL